MALITPAGLEEFFEEAGSPLNKDLAAPEEVTPENLKQIVETARKYGVEIKLP